MRKPPPLMLVCLFLQTSQYPLFGVLWVAPFGVLWVAPFGALWVAPFGALWVAPFGALWLASFRAIGVAPFGALYAFPKVWPLVYLCDEIKQSFMCARN